jgi:hypothetical protein
MLMRARFLLPACLVLAASAPAFAQGEAALRDFFEGKTVVVRMDMPASQEGVDVFPDARRPMDLNQYSSRIKSYGIALRAGESTMITKIHIKDKLIEFQLGGGGYGTFGDDTSSSVYVASTPKSRREKELEDLVKYENDSDRRRRLQRELDDLRDRRRREDARNEASAKTAEEAKTSRIADKRLHGGSRFNIRYQDGVPPGIEPDGIMRALEEYVTFSFVQDRRIAPAIRTSVPATRQATGGTLRKGMTVAEVDAMLGRPEKVSDRTEGGLKVSTSVYLRGDERISADFVDGVLIRYSISSK